MDETEGALEGTVVLLVGSAPWLDAAATALETRGLATVHRTSSSDAVGGRTFLEEVDCVLVAAPLDDPTTVEVVESLATARPTTPVVVAAREGTAALASRSLAAGAADFVAVPHDEDGSGDVVADRLASTLASARREAADRRQASQFQALFEGAGSPRWLLDESGGLERANGAARRYLATDVAEAVGEPFWELGPWAADEWAVSDLRRVVEGVRDSGTTDRLVTSVGAGDELFELAVVPVHDAGSLTGLVVEGADIGERVSIYRELRRSEELHRVTLNNMTDTVLVTDDDGHFTYICPNVHFIFGYTAAEIREMGTIDALLGTDLFDSDALADEGVLKNIETTATDKAGRDHTLLINVREVAIQDGTLLYSCRDITKRKQREDALATLQETARDFLYAETRTEIAQHMVEDVPGVLAVEASAVYLFESDRNDLVPAAESPEMERLHGPLPSVGVEDESLASATFVAEETQYYEDVHDAGRLTNPASDLRSVAVIPLGDHGVFIAGSPEVGAFDRVKRELADLLAATAEAALDRVRRESRLREQERQLQQRNADLSALNRINEIIREIDQALVQAETREEIDAAVCERLTAGDRFAFAWIGALDSVEGTLEPRAWAGGGEGYLDERSLAVEDGTTEPAARTAATGEVTVVPTVATDLRAEAWRTAALSRDFRSVISVPLAYDDVRYGVLTVYAGTQDAFDETARAVLQELGETIASATSAIERKNALLTASVTRIRFDLGEASFVLSRLARDADCQLAYRGGVQQTPTGSNVFVTVDGASVDAVEAAAADLLGVDEVQRISVDGTEAVLRLHVTERFIAQDLADHGAVLRDVTAAPPTTTLVVDIPETVEVGHIVTHVEETFPGATVRSKRRVDRSTQLSLSPEVLADLTDRQLEVVQTAYYAGFFESPRESTGEEVAATLDISPSAFSRHTRTVQRKLFSRLFDDLGAAGSPADGH